MHEALSGRPCLHVRRTGGTAVLGLYIVLDKMCKNIPAVGRFDGGDKCRLKTDVGQSVYIFFCLLFVVGCFLLVSSVSAASLGFDRNGL